MPLVAGCDEINRNMAAIEPNPLEIAQKVRHLPGLLAHQAVALGERVLWREDRRQLTVAEWHLGARSFAARLADRGVRPGDVAGLRLAETAHWPVALFGLWQAGAVVLPVSASLSAAGAGVLLQRAGARWLVTGRGGGSWPGEVGLIPFHGRRLGRARKEPGGLGEAVAGPESVALLAPTSGTTGEPKLAELTHGNLLMSAAARAVLVRHQPFDRVLSWLPLTHLYALNADVVKGLLAGVQAVRPVRARGILRALGKWRPTHFQAVPRLYEKAWHLAGGEKATEESLKRVFGGRMRWAGCGGAPLPGWLAEGYARLGLPILEGYGLTEASPLVTMNTPEAHRAGTAGRVVPGMGVEIAADGEILVRGAGVMRGYHRDAGATARVLREGWLHTGDLGTLEDGYLRVTGRKNDLIVLSTGRKVMPARVEGALLALPWVETAVAFGDGEPRVRALVRARAGMTPMWSIRTLEGLEEHEQPARLLVMDRPLSAERGEVTALGKVNRAVVVRHFTGTV